MFGAGGNFPPPDAPPGYLTLAGSAYIFVLPLEELLLGAATSFDPGM